MGVALIVLGNSVRRGEEGREIEVTSGKFPSTEMGTTEREDLKVPVLFWRCRVRNTDRLLLSINSRKCWCQGQEGRRSCELESHTYRL